MTAGLDELGSRLPTTFSVFIYEASTSVSLYAAQLVRLSAELSGSTVQLVGTAGQKHLETKPNLTAVIT